MELCFGLLTAPHSVGTRLHGGNTFREDYELQAAFVDCDPTSHECFPLHVDVVKGLGVSVGTALYLCFPQVSLAHCSKVLCAGIMCE